MQVTPLYFFFFFNYYLLWAVLGLPCCTGFSLVVVSRAYSLAEICRLLTAVVSLIAEHRL